MHDKVLTSEILSDFDITDYKKESEEESEDSDEEEGISMPSLQGCSG